MPAPDASTLQRRARAQFGARRLTVPSDWSPPSGEAADQLAKVVARAGGEIAPDPVPPALFRAASANPLHVATQRSLSRTIGEYLDGICAAICAAWRAWQEAASISGVEVNGVTATGGTVAGPVWKPLILSSAPSRTPAMLKFSKAIATAISNGWLEYQATIKIADLPFYPTFASYPGAIAPPTANVPIPFSALAQAREVLSKAALKARMIAAFDDRGAPFAETLFESVAAGFELSFAAWQASTMVTNVMGTGPIPTYAPPLVPSGPVVAGTASMASGGLA